LICSPTKLTQYLCPFHSELTTGSPTTPLSNIEEVEGEEEAAEENFAFERIGNRNLIINKGKWAKIGTANCLACIFSIVPIEKT
jgi:hypothetical protein